MRVAGANDGWRSGLGRGVLVLPVVGQEVGEFFHGVGRDSAEDQQQRWPMVGLFGDELFGGMDKSVAVEPVDVGVFRVGGHELRPPLLEAVALFYLHIAMLCGYAPDSKAQEIKKTRTTCAG